MINKEIRKLGIKGISRSRALVDLFFRFCIAALCVMAFSVFSTGIAFAEEKKPLDKAIDNILPLDAISPDRGDAPLPTGDLKTQILPSAIKIVLGLVATMTLIVFVYAGIKLIIAQGNEEELKKFKTMLIWSVIGLILITTSYAIVRGIMQLVFE